MLVLEPEVVFLFPKVFKEIYYEGCDYHLGAGYIRAFLGEHGVSSHQHIDSGDRTIDDVARQVLALRPSIVGFSPDVTKTQATLGNASRILVKTCRVAALSVSRSRTAPPGRTSCAARLKSTKRSV
jgi:hypothetical protein